MVSFGLWVLETLSWLECASSRSSSTGSLLSAADEIAIICFLSSLLKVLSSSSKAPCFFVIISAITCFFLHRVNSNQCVFSVELRICQQLSFDRSKQSAFTCLVFQKLSQLQQKSSPLEFAFLNIPVAYDSNSQFKYFLEFRVQKNE